MFVEAGGAKLSRRGFGQSECRSKKDKEGGRDEDDEEEGCSTVMRLVR